MRKTNFSVGIAIAIVMTAALMASGCVDDAADIAEDISDIGSKEYQETFIKGEKRLIAADSEYALLLKHVRDYIGTPCEVVIEIFSDFGNVSIGQRTLEVGVHSGVEMKIERLTLELVDVDTKEEYAEIKISEKIDVVGVAKQAGGTAKKVAEGIAESVDS